MISWLWIFLSYMIFSYLRKSWIRLESLVLNKLINLKNLLSWMKSGANADAVTDSANSTHRPLVAFSFDFNSIGLMGESSARLSATTDSRDHTHARLSLDVLTKYLSSWDQSHDQTIRVWNEFLDDMPAKSVHSSWSDELVFFLPNNFQERSRDTLSRYCPSCENRSWTIVSSCPPSEPICLNTPVLSGCCCCCHRMILACSGLLALHADATRPDRSSHATANSS